MQTKRRIRAIKYPCIRGNTQAIAHSEDGITTIYLSGDRDGLLSLSKIMKKLADVDQTKLEKLPDHFASEHIHLKPNLDLSKNSIELVISRLDDKNGNYDETFKKRQKERSSSHFVNTW